MQWIWITSGLLMLMSAWVINRFLHIRKAMRHGHDMNYQRLKCSRKALRLIRRACKCSPPSPELEALKSCRTALIAHIRRIYAQLSRIPPLPANQDGRPRLMALAHDICDAGRFSPDALVHAIADDTADTRTYTEVWSLPLCVAAAQVQRLSHVLRAIIADAGARTAALRLFRQLQRTKQPSKLLAKSTLSSAGLAALYQHVMHKDDAQQTSLLRTWLEEQELSPDFLLRLAQEHQQQLIGELHRALECFSSLEQSDWMSRCEEADPLHPILQQDPSDTYAKLNHSSRHHLKLQIDRFCRRTGCTERAAAQQALALSLANQGSTPEGCISWYFQERAGLIHLHRALRLRKGWLWVRLHHSHDVRSYVILLVYGILTGFAFLHTRQPVFILPLFSLVAGCISRYFILRLPHHDMPQLSLSFQDKELRTAIFLHAVLPDPSSGQAAVRQLYRAARVFPANTHFLLLGDFSPSITARSGTDLDVLQATVQAIAALEDPRFIYLHRSRVWNETQHCYSSSGGRLGALIDLCKMIAHGESGTSLVFSTQSPASLERQYAYVFMLGENQLPTPGILEALLSTMTHPLVNRIPTSKGWRGCSALSPEDMAFPDGMVLIRPTTLLEATDGIVSPAAYTGPLFAELGGHACVPGIRISQPARQSSWADVYQGALHAWRLLAWQLSHVQTPSGLIRNPLRFLSRFRLREHLRHTLIPLGQLGLVLWSVLTRNIPLLIIALLSPIFISPFTHERHLIKAFIHLVLHPTAMIVNLLGAFDALFGIRRKAPDFASIEIWTQVLTATVFAALGFALPGGSLPALMLAALFTCFPLAHRQK
ncbi:MAG: hypothetical protein E7318_04815 [Clostridiales bacterium]|nr:hypothetical protein [Clostridiales bacterium]